MGLLDTKEGLEGLRVVIALSQKKQAKKLLGSGGGGGNLRISDMSEERLNLLCNRDYMSKDGFDEALANIDLREARYKEIIKTADQIIADVGRGC